MYEIKFSVPHRVMQREKRTKICHVIESGSLSGSGRLVAAVCARLDPNRFDITLIYAVRPETTTERFAALFPSHVAMIYLPEMVRAIRLHQDIPALRKLYRLFRTISPDVVHAHSSKAGFLARLSAWAARVPKIYYSPHGYSFRMTDVSLIARGLYFCAEWLASRIGYTIVNGPSDERWAHRLTSRHKILPYYNGLEVSLFTPQYAAVNHERLVVATCGRITAARIPEAFVRLCKELSTEFPDVQFVWIGSGEASAISSLLAQVKQLKLDRRFQLTGWLSHEQAMQELSRADVVVHYSRWDVLPTAVLEAMALGKPVVGSTAVDQLIHGETGFIARTEDELVGYVRELLKSWELRASLGNTARKVVEDRYSLHRLIAQLESVYSGT